MLRDRAEAAVRAWDRYETARGNPAVVDYDCCPGTSGRTTAVEPADSAGTTERGGPADSTDQTRRADPDDADGPDDAGDPVPATTRLDVYRRLSHVLAAAKEAGEHRLAGHVRAHRAYLAALLGERHPLDDYIRATQGCPAAGWPSDYVEACGERAREHLRHLGVGWGERTEAELEVLEGAVDVDTAQQLILAAAAELEPAVRRATGATAPFDIRIEIVNVDAYWSYWLDGAGSSCRLRLNVRRGAGFTRVGARQFALHEILGHAMQSACWADQCARRQVDWMRLMSVHTPHQVLLEGLAQALPLLVCSEDVGLVARVRLDHYLQLVRAELHRAVNAGATVDDCVRHARKRVPFWTDEVLTDLLADRSTDPLLRSYLWAYPAGMDWFVALADHAGPTVTEEVLHAAYRDPLTPADLERLWPAGPRVGGPG
jgi:hypothetical protein